MIKRISVTLLSVAVLAVSLVGCGSDDNGNLRNQSGSSENFLLRGNSGEPGTLDPHLARTSPEFIIVADLFTGLITQSVDGVYQPGLADNYTVSEDGLTWTFTLREGITWSDGVAISSEDFLFSFRRVMDPATASTSASLLYPIKNARAVNAGESSPTSLGVSAPDPKTVIFELEHPTPYFESLLAGSSAMPVPKHVIDAHGDRWARPPHAVSSGPFLLSDWSPRVHVEVSKNEKFYDAHTVKLDGVRYLPTEDLATQLKRFRAGELDIGLNFPPSQTEWVRKNLAESIRIFPIYGTYYYPFNLTSPKFSDPKTRRALNIAIDRKAITDRLLGSGETPAYSFVPPGFENYPEPTKPDYAAEPMADRQAEARRLLADAGYNEANPLQVEIRYNMHEEHQAIAVAIAGMWNAVGIETELLSTEMRTHFKDLAIGEFEVGRAAMWANYPDPKAFLVAFASNNKSENYSKYSDAAFDEMLEQTDTVFDPAARGAALKSTENYALAEYPVIPIYYYVSKRLVSTRVKGFKENSVGTHLSRYMSLEEVND